MQRHLLAVDIVGTFLAGREGKVALLIGDFAEQIEQAIAQLTQGQSRQG